MIVPQVFFLKKYYSFKKSVIWCAVQLSSCTQVLRRLCGMCSNIVCTGKRDSVRFVGKLKLHTTAQGCGSGGEWMDGGIVINTCWTPWFSAVIATPLLFLACFPPSQTVIINWDKNGPTRGIFSGDHWQVCVELITILPADSIIALLLHYSHKCRFLIASLLKKHGVASSLWLFISSLQLNYVTHTMRKISVVSE